MHEIIQNNFSYEENLLPTNLSLKNIIKSTPNKTHASMIFGMLRSIYKH